MPFRSLRFGVQAEKRPAMLDQLQRVQEISGAGVDGLPDEVARGGRPVVMRGALSNWPFVRAALQSDEAAVQYLERFYRGRPVGTLVAPQSEAGRFFYQRHSKRMNFRRSSESLSGVLRGLLEQRKAERPFGIAMQAIAAAEVLPGLEEDNPNPFVPKGVPARLWIGNRVTVAPHFDVADNLACVTAGRRRFVLFPPEQAANLYPGPMDVTPASVPISMVSLESPELERYPRYREALDAALVAELDPGDAIFIPYLWWHGVESLSRFNILTNYWWNRDDDISPRYPFGAFLHLSYVLFHDMPPSHRDAWRALYDHYVFQSGGDPMEALDEAHRYYPGKLDLQKVARLKDLLRDLLGT
jgi:hypothetical protein